MRSETVILAMALGAAWLGLAAPPASAQALTPFPEPGIEAPEVLWEQVLTRGDPERVFGSYAVLGDLTDDNGDPDAARCACRIFSCVDPHSNSICLSVVRGSVPPISKCYFGLTIN